MDTRPDITTIIRRTVKGNRLLVIDVTGHPEEMAFLALLEEQHHIRWDLFFLG